MFICNCSKPKTTTITQSKIETITPSPEHPNNHDDDKEKNKITSFTTTVTTITLYYPGYTTTVTTTNSKGELTSYATYIPPSTVIVVKTQIVDVAMLEGTSDSTILYDFNRHSLLGVIMSLAVVATTLVFMIVSP
jgi:uncharacterized membrane protein